MANMTELGNCERYEIFRGDCGDFIANLIQRGAFYPLIAGCSYDVYHESWKCIVMCRAVSHLNYQQLKRSQPT